MYLIKITQYFFLGFIPLSLFFMSVSHAHATESTGAIPLVDSPSIMVSIVGDSLADGIWGGLFRQLQPRKHHDFTVSRRARNGTGLARPDVYDWQKGLGEVIETDHPDVIIICFGLNDRQDNFVDGKRKAPFKSQTWKTDYESAIGQFIDKAVQSKAAVYWVGLPSMRDQTIANDAQYLNEIYETQSKNSNISYISWFNMSVDENGAFASHLKANDGKVKLLRAEDGMHFTSIGYEVLAKNLIDRMTESIAAGSLKHALSPDTSDASAETGSDAGSPGNQKTSMAH